MMGIVDYDCGNLRSLENALDGLGLAWRRCRRPAELAGTDRLILPGVGHFGHAMQHLAATGLAAALAEHAGRGGRLLGICLGMQLLADGSAEAPDVPGLGLAPGVYERFDGPSLKVPHMGWNRVAFDGAMTAGAAYFVHSYYLPGLAPGTPGDWQGTCAYGGREFVAAFRRGNLTACQFHPEKSGRWGLDFLREVLTC
jgi:imidazole glycerol phosphate synthase glutamine amidotransferase subunit